MKATRAILVVPFELVLAVCVGVHLLTEFVCLLVGSVCQLIGGDK